MKRNVRRNDRRRGFTLIELTVVLVILAILAAAIIPTFAGKTIQARQTKAQADIAQYETLLELFYYDMGRYPTTEEGLTALLEMPEDGEEKWKGPYLKKAIRPDPWGQEYVYRSPGIESNQAYEVLSYGADGQPGGEGENADITSWQ